MGAAMGTPATVETATAVVVDAAQMAEATMVVMGAKVPTAGDPAAADIAEQSQSVQLRLGSAGSACCQPFFLVTQS